MENENNEFLDKHIPVNQTQSQNIYVPDVDLTVNTKLTDGTEIDYVTKTQLGANKGSFLGLNRGEEPSKSIFGIGAVPFKKIMELATSGIHGSELGGVVIGNQMKNFYKMAVSEIALYNTLNPRNQKKLLSEQFINDEITEEEYLKELDSLEKNYAKLKDLYKTDVGQELLADQQYIEEKYGKILKPSGEDKANRFAFDLGAGAVSYIGSIGSFLLFKNPSLSIAMLSIPEGMQAYNKAIEAGKRGGEAQKIGAEEFTWIAVTEYLGTKALFSILNRNGVLSKYAQRIFKKSPVFAKTASAVATEGGQEAIQDAGSDVLYNIHDIADYTLLDIVKDSLYSFLIGGALGGLTGGLKGIYDWRKVYKSEVGRIYALRNEDGSYKYSLDEAKQIAKTTVNEAFSQELVHEVIGLTKKERENYLAQKAQEEATKQIQKNFEDKIVSLNASRNIIYQELSVVDKKVKNQAQKLGIDENSAEMMSQMVQNLSKLYFNAFGITPLEYYGRHQIDIKIDNGKIYVDNRDTGKSVLFDEAVATRGILNNNIRQIALATKCSENINDLVKLTQKLVKEGVVSQAQINNMFIKFGEQARNIPKLQDIVTKVQDDYIAELLGDTSFDTAQLDEETRREQEEQQRKENEALEAELKAIQEYESSPQYKRDINRMKKDMLDSAIEYLMNGSNGNGFVVRIPTKNISPDRIGEYKALSDKIKRTFFSSKSSITYDQLESWIREKYGLENFDLFKYLSDLETRMNNVEVFRQGERGSVTMPTARIRWYQQHTKIIELLKSADKTTLFHELSHVYLRELEILRYNRGRTNPDLDETFRVLDKWLGEPTNGQYTKAQQEKFAKGFESYLATGKTPNSALAGVFEKVREWFKEVYYNARYLIDLSPEVEMMFRGMFNVNLEREALESFMRRPESKILNTDVATNNSKYNQDAYHGTPHKHNKFSTKKIGTGQGARLHGWGLYFTKNKELAEQYRRELSWDRYREQTRFFDEEKLQNIFNELEEKAVQIKDKKERDVAYKKLALIEDLLIFHDEQDIIKYRLHDKNIVDWYKNNIREYVLNRSRKQGQLFKVDIPEDNEMLDEQKPFQEQPEQVQKALLKILPRRLGWGYFDIVYNNNKELFNPNGDLTKQEAYWEYLANPRKYFKKMWNNVGGGELYEILTGHNGGDDKKASLQLNDAGVKGITYIGGQDGKGYVVFDDNSVDILEKYYQPAYNGSPNQFDKFSTDYIGTGQGALAHGWGLYFAQDRAVSEEYRQTLAGKEVYYEGEKVSPRAKADLYLDMYMNGKKRQLDLYQKLEKDFTRQIKEIEEGKLLQDFSEKVRKDALEDSKQDLKYIKETIKTIEEADLSKMTVGAKGGQVAKVEIPDDDVLLDEQANLEDQPKKVLESIKEMSDADKKGLLYDSSLDETDYKETGGKPNKTFGIGSMSKYYTGKEFYKLLSKTIQRKYNISEVEAMKEASLLLNKYGIQGLTYEGLHDGKCYVIFDDNAVDIMEKYYQGAVDEQQKEELPPDTEADPSILTRDNVDTFFQEEVDDVIDPNYGQEQKKSKPKSNERAVADLIQPLSSQVGKIVRAGEGLLRIYEAKLSIHKQQYLDVAQDFLRKTKRLKKQNRKDWYIFSKAVYNGDGEMIEKVLKKYPYLREGYSKVRDLLDNKIKDELRNVGVDVDSFTDRIYYPRKVDDIKGLIGFLRKNEMWSEIERAMEEKDKDWEKNWSDDAKADFINKWLKGYTNTKITNTSDNTKQRKIDELTDEMMRYYKNINDSLIDYLSAQNNLIETAKFLGVKKEQLAEVTGPNGVTNTKKMVDIIEGELTKVVRKLVENKEISYEQEEKLRELLKARFNFQNSPAWVSLLKSLAFLSSLNNVTTALTQLGDLAWAFRVSIPYTLKNIPKAFFDKAKLSMRRHLGLDDPTQELTDTRLTNLQIVNRALSVVLGPFFSRIDKLGKNTYINTVYDKYRKMIKTKKGEQKLYEQFEELYGKDYADLFINALKQDEVTEDIALLAFAELAKVQPVALSEMPREYLESPKGRMFYALKTFTIKQLDTVYTQSIRKIRRGMEEENSELVGEGVADMALYMFFFFILTSSKDILRDILFNRELDFTDIMFDNLLSLFGITKYAIYNGREYNIENFWHSLVDFPLINQAIRFNSDIQKVIKGKKGIKDLSIWRNAIPLFGDFYDEYYGGAKERKDKKKKKKETKQRPIKGFVF